MRQEGEVGCGVLSGRLRVLRRAPRLAMTISRTEDNLAHLADAFDGGHVVTDEIHKMS